MKHKKQIDELAAKLEGAARPPKPDHRFQTAALELAHLLEANLEGVTLEEFGWDEWAQHFSGALRIVDHVEFGTAPALTLTLQLWTGPITPDQAGIAAVQEHAERLRRELLACRCAIGEARKREEGRRE